MADVGGRIDDLVGGLFGGVLDISVIVVVAVIAVAFILGVVYYFFVYRRKFDIRVKIFSERAQDPKIYFDKAAILKDKKDNKFFKLWKTKVELEVPPFTVMESTNEGDYLELWRKSEDEFVFLTSPKIDKTKLIKADGKTYTVARTSQTAVESDLYWTSKRREDNKKLLDPESMLMKLLAWAPQIVSSVFLLIILWVLMDKLPELFTQAVELTKELRSLKGGIATQCGT